MTTLRIICILQIVCLAALLAGCGPEPHDKALGSIDLSVSGSKCEGVFRWSSSYPSLVLYFSDTNGPSETVGGNPDWPISVQVEVFDGSKEVASSPITREQLVFANWTEPATCLLVQTPNGFFDSLRAGHAYKFVLTVSQEQKSLGSARVAMHWVAGGDSM
jgi:hypothetical protein